MNRWGIIEKALEEVARYSDSPRGVRRPPPEVVLDAADAKLILDIVGELTSKLSNLVETGRPITLFSKYEWNREIEKRRHDYGAHWAAASRLLDYLVVVKRLPDERSNDR
jgi:hypothetical protein